MKREAKNSAMSPHTSMSQGAVSVRNLLRQCVIIPILVMLSIVLIAITPLDEAHATPKHCPYDIRHSIMYNYLSDNQRTFFDNMYDGIYEGKSVVSIPSGMNDTELQWMVDFIYNEAPELCAYDRWNSTIWGYTQNGKWVSTEFHIEYKMSISEQKRFISEMTSVASQFKGKGAAAGIKAIHEFVCKQYSYGTSSAGDTQLAYYAWKTKKALCNGYSQTFVLLCHLAGYDCSYVDGQAGNPGSMGGHAWNVYAVNNNMLYADSTWDDAGSSANWEWFGVTLSGMEGMHAADPEYSVLPRSGKLVWIPVAHRLAGATALDTMSKIVDAGSFPTGGTVVLTTVDGYWDALTAAGIAGLTSAPVLMTDGSTLSSQTRLQLAKLKPKTIIVCGGKAAVKDSVANAAKAAAGAKTVTRCAGQTATGTAVDIFKKGKLLGKWSDTAFVCTNAGYWDALAAAPISYSKHMPIFLTEGASSTSSETLNAMKAGGIKNVYIVGGTAAIKKSVETQLRNSGFTIKPRLAGQTAIETSEEVAKFGLTLGMSANRMGVATSSGYWDALAGAALCGRKGSVLVLADGPKAHSITGFMKSNASKITDFYVFGGTAAVTSSTQNAALAASKYSNSSKYPYAAASVS